MNSEAIETALEVLMWLSEMEDDGALRDDISRVRYRLFDWLGDLESE